ncbi:MAG: hypothetical protein P4L99_12820 [Chthoniobacter sp.]|nr:hypothetical protein [Chthoniobacter sp.]
MKAIVLQLLLGISLAAALFLSVSSVWLLYLMASAVPEETVYFRTPASTLTHFTCVALWPCALYLLLFIFARPLALSRFGRVVCAVQLVYVTILIGHWIYVSRLFAAVNQSKAL